MSNPSKHKGHTKGNKVCVVTAKGKHVRANFKDAEKLVNEGGKYIPKWQYEGEVNGEKVDWKNKKGNNKVV